MKPDEQQYQYQYEKHLELGLMGYVGSSFTREPSSRCECDEMIVANTARSSSQKGKWSRPDIMLITLQKSPLRGTFDWEVFSFELKRTDSANIDSAAQAAAHKEEFANYAYLVWHLPPNHPAGQKLEQVKSACTHHGVGLITFAEPHQYNTYETPLSPTHKPHPDHVIERALRDLLPKADYKLLEEKIDKLKGEL